jgi:hypothetical protein
MSLYTCGWFGIEELVDRNTFNAIGQGAWELFDERLLVTLDRMRVVYGPIWVNDWDSGKEHQWNGLWTPECPFYNAYSQHCFGRAANLRFENFSVAEVKNDIMNGHQLKEFEHVTTVMTTDEYLHIDVRNGERFTVLTA